MENTNILLTEEQVKGLKSYAWEKNHDTDTFYIGDISIECFTALTGYDLVKLQELKADSLLMGWDLIYGRPGTDEKNPTSYYLHGVIYINQKIFNEKYFISDVDFLGLYTKEEQEEGANWSDVLCNALTQVLQSKSIEDVVDYIDNNFPSISDKIREDCVNNLDASDLDDSLKEDIARDWIDDNSSDAFDRAWDNMDSYDIKNKIIDYLSDNL